MTPITYAMAYLMDKGHKYLMARAARRVAKHRAARCKAEIEAARKAHKPTRHIIARNQAEVVAALKGGA